jgi:hypothetical protein
MVEELGGDGRHDPPQRGDGPPDRGNLRHGRRQAKGAGKETLSLRVCVLGFLLSSARWKF